VTLNFRRYRAGDLASSEIVESNSRGKTRSSATGSAKTLEIAAQSILEVRV